MKVKILTGCSGMEFSFCQGDIVEVSSALGRDLIDGGLAEEIKTSSSKAKASVKENAES